MPSGNRSHPHASATTASNSSTSTSSAATSSYASYASQASYASSMTGVAGEDWRSLVTRFAREPKKAIVLAILAIFLISMWVKMGLSSGDTPQRAAGYTAATPSGSPDDSTGNGNDRAGAHSRAPGGDLQRWLGEEVPVVMSRNLFAVKLDYFPFDGSRPRENSRTQKDETFWDALAKSISSEADQQERRKNLVQNLREQADRLQLLSTVMGAKPKAMINGELVGEGDVIAAFRVIRIEARRVIVEREGIRLEITMK